MKKTLVMACVAVSSLLLTSCGGAAALMNNPIGPMTTPQQQQQQQTTGLGSILSGISGIGDILSSTLGITTTDIVGTWVYQEPAVLFDSENLLTKAGGQIAAKNVANKMNTYFQKVGITKGKLSMTFDRDGNFTQNISGKVQSGTYTINKGVVNLTYQGGVQQIVGSTQFDGNNLVIVVDVTKLMNFAQTIAAASNNATLNSLSSLAAGMTGMKTGLRFVKQ